MKFDIFQLLVLKVVLLLVSCDMEDVSDSSDGIGLVVAALVPKKGQLVVLVLLFLVIPYGIHISLSRSGSIGGHDFCDAKSPFAQHTSCIAIRAVAC